MKNKKDFTEFAFDKLFELIKEYKIKHAKEKREIFRFIMNNAGQNLRTKLYTVLLDESEMEEFKKLCEVEEK